MKACEVVQILWKDHLRKILLVRWRFEVFAHKNKQFCRKHRWMSSLGVFFEFRISLSLIFPQNVQSLSLTKGEGWKRCRKLRAHFCDFDWKLRVCKELESVHRNVLTRLTDILQPLFWRLSVVPSTSWLRNLLLQAGGGVSSSSLWEWSRLEASAFVAIAQCTVSF